MSYCIDCSMPIKIRRRCGKCYSKMWRSKNAIRSAFIVKKGNAKRDGIPFNITFREFKIWCSSNNYIKLKGLYPDSLTIDRIKTIDDNGKVLGYTIPNIQVLTLQENAAKGTRDRFDQWAKKRAPYDPDCPF